MIAGSSFLRHKFGDNQSFRYGITGGAESSKVILPVSRQCKIFIHNPAWGTELRKLEEEAGQKKRRSGQRWQKGENTNIRDRRKS